VEVPTPSGPSPPAPDPPATEPVSFFHLIGARPIVCEGGRGRLDLTLEARHLRSLGIAHGGLLATLLDSVMGMAAGSLCPPDHYVVTVQLNVQFIRAARDGETLVATAEVMHSGRQTAFARGEIRTEADVLVAGGTATFLHLRHSDRTRGRTIERFDQG
jgi:uncharacterized protein (TIGR00369 family)